MFGKYDSTMENLFHLAGRSDNLYRAFTSATPLGRSWINIRWLISFRADRGVAFLKFSANCPLAATRPRPFFSFSYHRPPRSGKHRTHTHARIYPLVSSYYFRRDASQASPAFWRSPLYTRHILVTLPYSTR